TVASAETPATVTRRVVVPFPRALRVVEFTSTATAVSSRLADETVAGTGDSSESRATASIDTVSPKASNSTDSRERRTWVARWVTRKGSRLTWPPALSTTKVAPFATAVTAPAGSTLATCESSTSYHTVVP